MVQIIRFVSNVSNISIQNRYFPCYNNNFYRIARLLGTVFGNGKGFGSILTHDMVKYVDILSIINRFGFKTILSQEFGSDAQRGRN